MKHLYLYDLSIRRFLPWRRLVVMSPILVMLLGLLYLALLTPVTQGYAQAMASNDSIEVEFVGGWSSNEIFDTFDVDYADYDGDGDLDMAVANANFDGDNGTYSGLVNQVYRNDGAGNFTLVWESLGDEKISFDVEWGDYDNDGDVDLAFGNLSFFDLWGCLCSIPGHNQVYENLGHDNFELAWESPDEITTFSVAWGDYDGDGLLDLAVGNFGDVNQIYHNDGLGSFNVLSPFGDSKNTESVAWGDLDGDQDLDLVVGNIQNLLWGNGAENQVYFNDGGSFTEVWTSPSSEAKDTTSVALADMDRDGDFDLAFGNTVHGGVNGENQLYRNDGDGSFSLVWQSADGTKDTRGIAWGDVDSDGYPDLAVANTGDGESNRVYRNQGDGTFDLAWEIADEFKESRSVAWGDVDADGNLDLLFANGNDGMASTGEANLVYLNKTVGGFASLWTSSDEEMTSGFAWGDSNSDGLLDLVAGNWKVSVGEGVSNFIYRNEGAGNFSSISAWEASDAKNTWAMAWGDMDGDHDLDLAMGNIGDENQVYRNEGDGNFTLVWTSNDLASTASMAWGDMDGDGDLDLAVGNSGVPEQETQVNQVYRNEGNDTFSLAWESPDEKISFSVAWGDYDRDGDLDLAVGNDGDVNQLYQNDGNGNLSLAWESTGDLKATFSVAWGDYDADGDLDLAFGNYNQVNQIYRNDGGEFTLAWQSDGDLKITYSVAWADMNGNGQLDLVVGNWNQVNQIYHNDGRGNLSLAWTSPATEARATRSLLPGDSDNDGDLDLAEGNVNNPDLSEYTAQPNQVFENQRQRGTGMPNNAPFVKVMRPDGTAEANFYASSTILNQRMIPFTYMLFSTQEAPVARIEAFYSTDGGGKWLPAIATDDTITSNLASKAYPLVSAENTHIFTWDTFKSGFFGQSSNVVLRIVAHSQNGEQSSYPNGTAGPYLWPALSASTTPFSVRGTQVRVLSDSLPVAGAIVYRLPAGQPSHLFADETGKPFRSDAQGYLQGRGNLNIGDQLVALLPITATESYTLYHTSAVPTATGLDAFSVTTSGVQDLVVSPDNPLIVFDLDVSLEWDARNDEIFLTQLERDLERSSEILYDLTNGQVALGKIRVFHAKENWLNSHILIHASNNLRPGASLGGIVNSPISDTLATTEVITNAYLPGQVGMSAIWNRFGNPNGDVGEDWPRTLAHELGHYLLFIPDNYLGLSETGLLTKVDCQNSAMTDAYREDYSEFLTSNEWTGDCLETLAQHTTERTDWQTISSFYDMLNDSGGNVGPSHFPLKVTYITFIEPETAVNTLIDPFFNVTDENMNPLALPFGQAQGYLFKTQGTEEVSDDEVIALGSPIVDLLRARGAEPGDRLCLLDYSQSPRRLGCIEEINQSSSNLPLHEVSGWQPQITVNAITSRTLAITVTQAITSGDLYLQILPAAHPTTTGVITAPVAAMIPIGADTFTQTITLDYPQASGFVRLWLSDIQPLREEMTEYLLSGAWGPDSGGDRWGPDSGGDRWGPDSGGDRWGPSAHRYGWGVGVRNWQAPMTSRDAQVTIFDIDHILGDHPAYALQSLSVPPNLPLWLTQVGQAYRFSAADELTGTLNIMFTYMQREVPAGYEDGLRIYYSPNNGGQVWQRLNTELDTHRNLASALMPGEGVYVLISTIEMPPFSPGWNNPGYPVAETRAISTALASIDGYYTSVYNYDPFQSPPWSLYDRTVLDNQPEFSALVNDLTHLQFGHSYWIYATEAITWYLDVPNNRMTSLGIQLPPATFYGVLTPTTSFTPTVGMALRARIDGNICGETTIQEWNGQLAYKLQVQAENLIGDPNGCGESGRQILFEVGDWLIEQEEAWDNSQAWWNPLTMSEQLANLNASVTLQGRPAAPDPSLRTPLTVTLTIPNESEPAYTIISTTNENGDVALTGIVPARYEVRVKTSTTLQNMLSATFSAGDNQLDLGTLREGDANNDNYVTIPDFSILASTFGKCAGETGYDQRADFNADGCITLLDFSLLAANFGEGADE